MKRLIVFLMNLVQDVSVCRPLIRLVRDEVEADILLLYTDAFLKRDANAIWLPELQEIAAAAGAETAEIAGPYDAVRRLGGRRGLIVAASETDLPAHQICHDVFLCSPPGFLRVTLQHGFECVGFMHNRAHDRAHGAHVGFGADVVVGWTEGDRLFSMRPDQRQKLFVAGPPGLIPGAPGMGGAPPAPRPPPRRGLVCENLHSVRLAGASRRSFLDILGDFAAEAQALDVALDLRSHPGGRYLQRTGAAPPEGVRLNTLPLYKQTLGEFAFGISAPSSIVLDLMFADVPAALWQDADEPLDLSNYAGLRVIGGADSWWDFAFEALTDPAGLIAGQRAFLASLGIPADVRGRYLTLLHATR
ncbi:hypothetical protein OPKNFCMD_4352 [Methylobacterium crusticola]|uniref:Uncharacterized protein n=1 Tax=Methylobacterium crusticola TaxID=1697972 RepID=A0ABQ4R1N4_9HYPH|nr:hypothetical protein [Methylobacterium crusticola]GJD51597.1 hypothetical protein OPKNFCMD_4352 [Methylobacterium crusticola]